MYGLLAAHPLKPLVSLHHLEYTNPIFPNMTSIKALQHLFRASQLDPHRLLHQTVCYDRWFSWTISVSWGYAVEIIGKHVHLPDVLRVPATFRPWDNKAGNLLAKSFVFNTREIHPDPCRRPVVFFMDGVVPSGRNGVRSTYRKMTGENCSLDNGSPRKLEEVRVYSHKLDLTIKQLQAPRRHCCDVLPSSKGNVLEIGVRECKDDELISMHP